LKLALAALLLVLVLVGAAGYTTVAGVRVYQGLDQGATLLASGQARLDSGVRAGDLGQVQAAERDLTAAEAQFVAAYNRLRSDPAVRAAGSVPTLGDQTKASAHLAAIGADMSRAGHSLSQIALEMLKLKETYSNQPPSGSLEELRRQAQLLVKQYGALAQAALDQLKAAHQERAQVTTAGLIAPLQQAYQDVDTALAQADRELARYQDLRQAVSDFLGIALPQ
jgi:hypothetical protein